MKFSENNQLPFWREYPERDTEFVRVYPTLYGEISEKDIWNEKDIALYIHLPFCDSKCLSCTNILGSKDDIDAYLDSLKKEISMYASEPYIQDHKVKNLYIGGGTPSVVPAEKLKELIEFVKKTFNINYEIEINMEVIPNHITEDYAKKIYAIGVNRVSIGVQSLNDKELKELKKSYNSNVAIEKINLLKEIGFENINVDLLVGIPGQTRESWQETLSKVVNLNVSSISFYSFFLLETTELMTKMISGRLGEIKPKNIQDQWFYDAEEILFENGYSEFYSNGFEIYSGYSYAKKGKGSSYYKDIYSRDLNIIGVGTCASGHLNNKWYYNETNVNKYIEKINNKDLPLMKGAIIKKEDYLRRYIILNLKKGILFRKDYYDAFGIDVLDLFGEELNKLANENLITITPESIQLVRPKGYYYISNICKEFYSEENKMQPQLLGQAIVM